MKENSSNLLYVDAMFGKLGHFLRILGFDTEIADPKLKDMEILEHILTVKRVLITRDRLFYEITQKRLQKEKLPKEMVLFLPVEELYKQIHGVFHHIRVKPEELLWIDHNELNFLPRCSLCNAPLTVVEKHKIISLISSGTASKFHHFWQCSNDNCKKIYWRGRHWQDIKELLERTITFGESS